MTNCVGVYLIQCSHCGQTISLLETQLDQIIHHRLISDAGVPFLPLVCSECHAGMLYNYAERKPLTSIPKPPPDLTRKYPVAFLFRSECVDDACISLVQLTAVRDFGTRIEDVIVEFPIWNLEAIRCDKGHALFFPDPKKSYRPRSYEPLFHPTVVMETLCSVLS